MLIYFSTEYVLFRVLFYEYTFTKTTTRNEKILQGEKTLLFMKNVHIIMHNTSRSDLNGLIIIIIFFQ